MQRFYFHVEDGVSYPDRDGTVLASVESARIEAIRLFAGLLRDNPETFWNGDEWKMTVTDDTQLVLFTLSFMAFDAPATKRYFTPRDANFVGDVDHKHGLPLPSLNR